MIKHYDDLHPDLIAFKNDHFALRNEKMEENIGRTVEFIDKTLPVNNDVFEIVGVQTMWGHDANGRYVSDRAGYRVVGRKDVHRFGKPALPEAIVFVD